MTGFTYRPAPDNSADAHWSRRAEKIAMDNKLKAEQALSKRVELGLSDTAHTLDEAYAASTVKKTEQQEATIAASPYRYTGRGMRTPHGVIGSPSKEELINGKHH